MEELVVFGAGTPGCLKLLQEPLLSQKYRLKGFVDDGREAGDDFYSAKVLGKSSVLKELDSSTRIFNNVFGSMKARRVVANLIAESHSKECISLISQSVDLTMVQLASEGILIEQNVVLDACVHLGRFSAVKRAASVGHETKIGDFCFVGPGATICGRVTVGDGSYIGAGAIIRDNVTIGENAVVGLGAVVVKDVAAGTTVMGNPARVRN
jgi:sugar O-acyltransferase (sialic acid O-acetyltransferase NeuD family)